MLSSTGRKILTRDKIRKYQTRVIRRAQKQKYLMLQIDMGLGKTIMVLTAARYLLDRFEIRRLLVIAPLLVAEETWPEELESWEHTRPITYEVLTGTAERREARARIDAEVHIINRENLPWLVEFWGDDWPYDAAAIDEISGFKNPARKTKPTKKAVEEALREEERLLAKGIANPKVKVQRFDTRFGAFCKIRKKLTWVIGMTGTPAPNGLIDLWSQYYMLDQGERLGTSFTAFRDRWFDSDYMKYKWTPRSYAFDEIMGLVKDITISMDSADYLELPPRVDIPVMVHLSDKQMKDYKRFERTCLLEEHDIEAVNEGVLTGKLLQLANGSIYDEDKKAIQIHDLKLDALERIVAEHPGQPILVAYSYLFDVAKLKKRFPKARFIKEKPENGDRTVIKDWNAGKVEMLIVHPASAGHGLNLQHGGYIAAWYGLPWSLELYMQFNKRLHRSGQKADRVLIYHILAAGTVDERVMQVLQSKNVDQSRVIAASKMEYSAEEDEEPVSIAGDFADVEDMI